MKVTTLFVIYFVGFMFFFFLLSAIGTLWFPYKQIISEPGWFAVYAVFIGSWLGIMPARAYYLRHEDYFDKFF